MNIASKMPNTSRKILVVEDIPDTLSGTLAELNARGVVTPTVGSISEAQRELSSEHFDAIILDWRIPGQTGEYINDDGGGDLLQDLSEGKSGRLNQQTPVVVVTAQGRAVDTQKTGKFPNCIAVVPKMEFGRLFRTIEKVLGLNSEEDSE